MVDIYDFIDYCGGINDSSVQNLMNQEKYDDVYELAEACLKDDAFVPDGFTWLEELRKVSYAKAIAKLENLKLTRNHEYMMYSCNPAEEEDRSQYKIKQEEDLERKWREDHQQLKELVEGVIEGKEITRECIFAAFRGEGNEVTIDLVQWESYYEDLNHAFASWGEAGKDYFPKVAELIRMVFPDILDIIVESCSLNVEDEALEYFNGLVRSYREGHYPPFYSGGPLSLLMPGKFMKNGWCEVLRCDRLCNPFDMITRIYGDAIRNNLRISNSEIIIGSYHFSYSGLTRHDCWVYVDKNHMKAVIMGDAKSLMGLWADDLWEQKDENKLYLKISVVQKVSLYEKNTQELLDWGIIFEDKELSYNPFQKYIYHKAKGTDAYSFGCLKSAIPVALLFLLLSVATVFMGYIAVGILIIAAIAPIVFRTQDPEIIKTIKILTDIQVSDGTVFYTAGSLQSQMTIVLIQDCDIPAFSGFISSQDNLYRKTDTLWERYDERLESGCGNTERLTIDLEKKYIKYQFVVY